MLRRREFGMAGLSAAALLAMQSTGWAQPGNRRNQEDARGTTGEHAGHGDDRKYVQCAKACNDCQRECDACANHCTDLLAQGEKEQAETLRTCQDCADVCATAAQIVARKGPFSADICMVCAEICAKCAEHCESHGQHDEMMKRCAEECRTCEKACREMIGHTGHGAEHRNRPESGARQQ